MDKNIVLIGMPGSGKSSLGRKLATKVKRPFYDIDEEIVSRRGKTIEELFMVSEDYFREVESQVTIEVAKEQRSVIATGGGTILRQENMDALKENGLILFIDRSLEQIASDVVTENRPLLKEQGLKRLNKLYQERIAIYRATADVSIQNEESIEKALDAIIQAINSEN